MLRENRKTVTINQAEYPRLLREISDPPSVLYYRGQWPDANLFPLAIVGSRQADNYGQETVRYLLSEKIKNRTVIISGLAIGIDAAAHFSARRTIAVLGTGLDQKSFYPQKNWPLAEKMIATGNLILSEFPDGTAARSENFPRRNRLIAGLSRAVLVIEAKKRSGALITSRLALENGRDVMAVPGSIFNPLCTGTNNLIIQGAIPITSPEELEAVIDYLA